MKKSFMIVMVVALMIGGMVASISSKSADNLTQKNDSVARVLLPDGRRLA